MSGYWFIIKKYTILVSLSYPKVFFGIEISAAFMKTILILSALIISKHSFAQNKFIGHLSYRMETRLSNNPDYPVATSTYNMWFSENEVWRAETPVKTNLPTLLTPLLMNQGMDSARAKKIITEQGGYGYPYYLYDHFYLGTKQYEIIKIWAKAMTEQLIAPQESNVIVDTLPEINWQLSAETKKIDTLSCQKAVGRFRGRTYTAWYTKEIPIAAGPWKLHGLPGLIVEAEDSLGEVKFIFESLQIPVSTQPAIIDYNTLPRYSLGKFLAKQKEDREATMDFIKSTSGGDEALKKALEAGKKNKPRPIEIF
jgi:GLPGLI family protein